MSLHLQQQPQQVTALAAIISRCICLLAAEPCLRRQSSDVVDAWSVLAGAELG